MIPKNEKKKKKLKLDGRTVNFYSPKTTLNELFSKAMTSASKRAFQVGEIIEGGLLPPF
jgi:hypothetical protein